MSEEKEVGFVTMGVVEKAKEIKEIGVGMLGYAFMGKAHTNAYIKMPIFFYPPPAKPKLVAIFGRTEERVKEAARRFGYKKYYTDWRELIRDPEVEVVDNGLPNSMHKDPCIMAAELGKHVFCEKPLARDAKEAEEMYRAVEKAKVKHMVGFNYRFVPASRRKRSPRRSRGPHNRPGQIPRGRDRLGCRGNEDIHRRKAAAGRSIEEGEGGCRRCIHSPSEVRERGHREHRGIEILRWEEEL